MTRIIYFILSTFILLSCSEKALEQTTIQENKSVQYNAMTIPAFISQLSINHREAYLQHKSIDFNTFFETNNIDYKDSNNIKTYCELSLLHDLFTSKSPSDCSRGEIMNVPYFWHWVNPNPRYEIYLRENKTLLQNQKPPLGFEKYKNYADIDRTPNIFISDMFAESPKYYAASCDTFSTFGWCSEREMSFTLLSDMLGYKAKVVARGNHSWTELVVPFKTNQGKYIDFVATIDNTYDLINWAELKNTTKEVFLKDYGDSPLKDWYNKKAHLNEYKLLFSKLKISPKVLNGIDAKLVKYLKD